MKIERGRKIKTLPFPPSPHSRESGNLPLSGAGRATPALHLFITICAVGAGVGRFPLSREWERGVGMRKGGGNGRKEREWEIRNGAGQK